jgi:3-hydroxyisobutyrate dehydrogenase
MAARLLEAGFRLHVYSRDRARGADLVSRGAVRCGSVAELSRKVGVVITMVGDPNDVRALYMQDEGIVANARRRSYLVDMTTSTPELARHIYARASERGLWALDAPVSGGQVGAQNGQLTIMVGGDQQAFDALQPVFEPMGASIKRFGPAGAGQTTKMCNQIAVAGVLLGMAEALACAKASGVDPQAILDALRTSTAGSVLLERLGPKMLADDRQPSFYTRHFIKDLTIGLEEAKAMGLQLPGADLVRGLYERLANETGDEQGIQTLIHAYAPKEDSKARH